MVSNEAEALERAEQLLQTVRDLVLSREGDEVSVPNVWGRLSLETYSRLRSHLEGVTILVRDHLPEEALPLVRTMLSDSLLLMELASRPDDRLALAFGYYIKSLNALEGLGKTATAVKLAAESDWLPGVQAQRAALLLAIKERGAIPLNVRDDPSLARRHKRLDEIWTYRYASTALHRVNIGQLSRTRTKNEVLHLYVRNADPSILAATLSSAMTSALCGHRAAAEMLGWDEPPVERVDELICEVEEIFPSDDVRPSADRRPYPG